MARSPSPAALRAHDTACDRGQDGYLDPDTGLFVMTSAYLLRQQECCGNGCRHCPYDVRAQDEAGRPPNPAWPYSGGTATLRARLGL